MTSPDWKRLSIELNTCYERQPLLIVSELNMVTGRYIPVLESALVARSDRGFAPVKPVNLAARLRGLLIAFPTLPALVAASVGLPNGGKSPLSSGDFINSLREGSLTWLGRDFADIELRAMAGYVRDETNDPV